MHLGATFKQTDTVVAVRVQVTHAGFIVLCLETRTHVMCLWMSSGNNQCTFTLSCFFLDCPLFHYSCYAASMLRSPFQTQRSTIGYTQFGVPERGDHKIPLTLKNVSITKYICLYPGRCEQVSSDKLRGEYAPSAGSRCAFA